MTAADQLKSLLPALGAVDRITVLEQVSQMLGGGFPGIESATGVCGGEPRIVRTRIPIWTLAAARRQGLNDEAILAAYPTLRSEDLAFAWAYCQLHADEIERQIVENQVA